MIKNWYSNYFYFNDQHFKKPMVPFVSWSLLSLGPFCPLVPFGHGPFCPLVPFGHGPFWVLVPFGWSLLAGPLWVGPFWLPTLKKKCIFSQITLKFLILSASAHTGFDHQSAKIPAKTCSMFPGHVHRTVLQNQKEYCNFKNFKQNILFYLSIRNNKLISWN